MYAQTMSAIDTHGGNQVGMDQYLYVCGVRASASVDRSVCVCVCVCECERNRRVNEKEKVRMKDGRDDWG